MNAQKKERCLPSALLLAIDRLGEVGEALVDPGTGG